MRSADAAARAFDAPPPSPALPESVDPAYDCVVCRELLCAPCVAPCGHELCHACFKQLAAAASPATPSCPSCRAPCPPLLAPSLLLSSLLRNLHPTAYAQRLVETADAETARAAKRAAADAPAAAAVLFVLPTPQALLPRQGAQLRLAQPHLLRLAHTLASLPPGTERRVLLCLGPCRPGDTATEAEVEAVTRGGGAAANIVLKARRRVRVGEDAAGDDRDAPRRVHVTGLCDEPDANAGETAALGLAVQTLLAEWRAAADTAAAAQLAALAAAQGALAPAASLEEQSLHAAAFVTAALPLLGSVVLSGDLAVAALRTRSTNRRLLLVRDALLACRAAQTRRGALGGGLSSFLASLWAEPQPALEGLTAADADTATELR